MRKYFDKQTFACIVCGHKWIIISNKSITDEQHVNWMKETMKHHKEVCKYHG